MFKLRNKKISHLLLFFITGAMVFILGANSVSAQSFRQTGNKDDPSTLVIQYQNKTYKYTRTIYGSEPYALFTHNSPGGLNNTNIRVPINNPQNATHLGQAACDIQSGCTEDDKKAASKNIKVSNTSLFNNSVGAAYKERNANGGGVNTDCNSKDLNSGNCEIVRYLVLLTRTLSAIVGIVVVTMIAVGGVQYSASRDNPQATQEAKNRIRNAVFALVAYLFIFAFLQWLVPGGVF